MSSGSFQGVKILRQLPPPALLSSRNEAQNPPPHLVLPVIREEGVKLIPGKDMCQVIDLPSVKSATKSATKNSKIEMNSLR